MSTYQTDSRINDYIATLPGWQQEMCRQVRDLVHAADPDVTETIKRAKQPYFTLNGNICALLGAKDHLNIFIYDPVAPDPTATIEITAATPKRIPSVVRTDRRRCPSRLRNPDSIVCARLKPRLRGPTGRRA